MNHEDGNGNEGGFAFSREQVRAAVAVVLALLLIAAFRAFF